MRARSSVTIRSDGRLAALRCEPPLTLRQVRSDDGRTGLCLVGTAAGPLAGDDLALDLHLEPHARARLQATGASLAQGRAQDCAPDGAPATVRLHARVGTDADLVADPGPLVVCAGSRVDVSVNLELAAGATVEWQELVVLGRSGADEPGAATIRWDVERAGRPLLRQYVDLADPHLRRWATLGHRVLATTLLSGPHVAARTVVAAPTAVAQRLDETSVLVSVLDDSAAVAQRRRTDLLGEIRR